MDYNHAMNCHTSDWGIALMKIGKACMLLISALFLAAPAVAEEPTSSACVIAAGDSVAEQGPAAVLALAPSSREEPFRLSFGCQDGSVSSLRVRSVPGQAVEARFLLVRGAADLAEIEWDDIAQSGWSQLDIQQSGGRSVATLRIDVPGSAAPGSVRSGNLRFLNESSGSSRSDSLQIPVMVEVIDGGPLFRDDFDPAPDPVIGQFSMVGH